ncbi:hypothetical protein [Candidatus Magnetomonas plexicatena]|uniref:hypothetical protein n=1 Tax=Candidatus Magnetomonas plexicatena TaxID=2552947 RepID=UPI001C742D8A|nr:hypothetical protein E2O03_011660 [Nitrospirales bacterium LBB_01]
MIDTAIDVNPDVERIHEMLAALSVERIKEASDFIAFLAEKERKHQAFVEETLAAEAEPDYVICNSAEELMEAIFNADDD